MARWSSQTMVSQRYVAGRHRDAELIALPVAHHQRTGGVEGDADNIFGRNAGFSRAVRTAVQTADQISRESCSA
jgi:hypothetical protein